GGIPPSVLAPSQRLLRGLEDDVGDEAHPSLDETMSGMKLTLHQTTAFCSYHNRPLESSTLLLHPDGLITWSVYLILDGSTWSVKDGQPQGCTLASLTTSDLKTCVLMT
ncbi:hypothetical protein FOL47_001702, partial [Perkinsus chesapeaki]